MMEKQLSRLAVAQVLLIVYIVFSAAIFLKARFGTTHPSFIHEVPNISYVMHLKDYGVWLLTIPAAWSLWSFWELKKPAADTESFSGLYLSGVIIAFGLVCVGVSTCSVLTSGTMIIPEEKKPRTSISGSRFDAVEPAQNP